MHWFQGRQTRLAAAEDTQAIRRYHMDKEEKGVGRRKFSNLHLLEQLINQNLREQCETQVLYTRLDQFRAVIWLWHPPAVLVSRYRTPIAPSLTLRSRGIYILWSLLPS